MSRVAFDPKPVGETATLAFDFTSQLAVGETISGAPVTASTYSGTDASPSSIISGSASISGASVSQKITAGTEGVIYNLTCTATTSAGQVLLLSGYLAVVADAV